MLLKLSRFAVRKNFEHGSIQTTGCFFSSHLRKIITFLEQKKNKCVENGHSKLEIIRKIKKKMFVKDKILVFFFSVQPTAVSKLEKCNERVT